MRLQVQPGWEPGITWDDHTYEPGETFNIDDEDAARQFLANGSAVEAPPNPSAAPQNRTLAPLGAPAQDGRVAYLDLYATPTRPPYDLRASRDQGTPRLSGSMRPGLP